MGGAAALSEKVPIVNWVDHGESVTYDKSDEWWKGRRQPWFREGIGKQDNERMDRYKAARAKGHHIVVKPGDRVPIKGIDAQRVNGTPADCVALGHIFIPKQKLCFQV